MSIKKQVEEAVEEVAEEAFHFILWESDQHKAQILAIVEHYLAGLKSPVQLPLEWLVDSIKAGCQLPHGDYGVPSAEHQ